MEDKKEDIKLFNRDKKVIALLLLESDLCNMLKYGGVGSFGRIEKFVLKYTGQKLKFKCEH